MQKIRWFFLIAVIAACLTVAIQNHDATVIQILFFERSLPLSALLIIAAVVGFLSGVLMTLWMSRKRSAKSGSATNARPSCGAPRRP